MIQSGLVDTNLRPGKDSLAGWISPLECPDFREQFSPLLVVSKRGRKVALKHLIKWNFPY